MGFSTRLLARVALCCLSITLVSSVAWAGSSRDRTQFGHDITVGPGEEVSEVTCFGCNIRVRGRVNSDVTVFGGSVVVEDQGEIASDLTAFGGNVRLDNGAKVNGDVTIFGGRMHRDTQAEIRGEVSLFSGSLWLVLIFALPLILLGAFVALIVWLVRLMTHRTVPPTAQRAA